MAGAGAAERIAGTGIDDPTGTYAQSVYSKAPPAKKAALLQLRHEAPAGLN